LALGAHSLEVRQPHRADLEASSAPHPLVLLALEVQAFEAVLDPMARGRRWPHLVCLEHMLYQGGPHRARWVPI